MPRLRPGLNVTKLEMVRPESLKRRVGFERLRMPPDLEEAYFDEHGNVFADEKLISPLGWAIVKTTTVSE
jgi:hypothetical protein